MKKAAYYGGTFDPVHCGHVNIAIGLVELFELDRFVFVPAFHAPHKPDLKPTSAFHRFGMLCLATAEYPKISVSDIEVASGKKQYSIDTISILLNAHSDTKIFFVMGADSWADITAWHEWEKLLLMTNHIVVSRPGFDLGSDHVSDQVRERIVDLRGRDLVTGSGYETSIFLTDVVSMNVSATDIRTDIQEDSVFDRVGEVPSEVAKYIEKYELYR